MHPVCLVIRVGIVIALKCNGSTPSRIVVHQKYAIIIHHSVSTHARAREQREGEQKKCGGYTAPREGEEPAEERKSFAFPLSATVYRAPFIHGAPLFLFKQGLKIFSSCQSGAPVMGTLRLSFAPILS